MSTYTVNDAYHSIVFNLNTRVYDTTKLKLKVFTSTNTSDTPDQTYDASTPVVREDESKDVTFTVKTSDFSIGSVLNRFIMEYNDSTYPITETNEGLTVLVDGEKVGVTHTGEYNAKFNRAGEHTIQFVYEGNETNSMAYTDVQHIKVNQTPAPDSPSVDGNYRLEFVDNIPSTLYFNDQTIIAFRLTKGGTPVEGKTVEIVTPTTINTHETNAKGIVAFVNNEKYEVGTYKIGAYFYDYADRQDKKVVDSTYKTITIKKHNLVVTDNTHISTGGSDTTRIVIQIKDTLGNLFPNKKVSVNTNGQVKTRRTSKTGKITILDPKKGTYKFKVSYAGNSHYEKFDYKFVSVIK